MTAPGAGVATGSRDGRFPAPASGTRAGDLTGQVAATVAYESRQEQSDHWVQPDRLRGRRVDVSERGGEPTYGAPTSATTRSTVTRRSVRTRSVTTRSAIISSPSTTRSAAGRGVTRRSSVATTSVPISSVPRRGTPTGLRKGMQMPDVCLGNNPNIDPNSIVDTIIPGGITPGAITDGAITDGAITEGAITDGAITDGAITDGAITDSAIVPGDITPGDITYGPTIPGAVTRTGPVTLFVTWNSVTKPL